MNRSAAIFLALALALAAGCSLIYASKGSCVTTHDGDVLLGTNKMTRIEITR